ncbi:hypothetical protein TNCV_3757801 [Trichonephila clavipes]|nr:hypothetical protein TNCV_3757801 [Trichonephila clavipes]
MISLDRSLGERREDLDDVSDSSGLQAPSSLELQNQDRTCCICDIRFPDQYRYQFCLFCVDDVIELHERGRDFDLTQYCSTT